MVDTQQNYKTYNLQNGLVVALHNNSAKTISARLRVNYGASHEKEGEEGLAHFLEHCLFVAGSEKYTPSQIDELRGDFGYSNAFTNIGRILFEGRILSEDASRWLDLTSQQAFYPIFDEVRVNGERERVLREISQSKSRNKYEFHREFAKLFYRGHPLEIEPLGNEEVVKQADTTKLRSFYGRGFHSNNMDLILVGGLPKNIEQLIENYFGGHVAGESTRTVFPVLTQLPERLVYNLPAGYLENLQRPEESLAKISLTTIVPDNFHPDSFTLRAIAHILGGDGNSMLYKNLGLSKGLAYFASSGYSGDYNAGKLGVKANVLAIKLREAIDTIFDQMKILKTEKVDEGTINRIKRKAKYDFLVNLESTEGCMDSIETYLDEKRTPEMTLKGFDSVTADSVLEVARKYLPEQETGKYSLFIENPLLK